MRILVVNAGSSSLKVSLVVDGVVSQRFDCEPGDFPQALPEVDAVGHRVVHGGTDFTDPVVVSPEVEARLTALTDLAPLHQPKSLAGLRSAREALPDVPHVACFDTAFHATLPVEAATYALPLEWRERYGLRRYGFHGLSHAWASRRAAELVPGHRRLVSCHLGAGASLAAVLDGRCVDTTMGFTPLEGLVMATRSGSVDPGLVLWLMEHEGLAAREVAEALEHRSGLAGLGGTGDLRRLLADDGPRARLAVDVYLHRLAASIAAMTAALGGLDVLLFTGGVGEGSGAIRERVAARLGHLGVAVDAAANREATPDAEIGAAGAGVRTLVVAAREDLEVAAGVARALATAAD